MTGQKKKTLIYACNGVSGLGRLTGEAAYVLEERGEGEAACLSGVVAGIQAKIASTRDADKRIALDGCRLACARKILEKAGLKDNISIVAVDCGIVIDGGKPSEQEVSRFADHVQNVIRRGSAARTSLSPRTR